MMAEPEKAETGDWDLALLELNARMNASKEPQEQDGGDVDSTANASAAAAAAADAASAATAAADRCSANVPTAEAYQPTPFCDPYDDTQKSSGFSVSRYIDTMTELEREAQRNDTRLDSAKGLLPFAAVVGGFLVIQLLVGVTGGLDHSVSATAVPFVEPSIAFTRSVLCPLRAIIGQPAAITGTPLC
ncbi:hypothetical protein T492DRAFT_1031935 [Pavlovales sp. CCMP2436]|nr:hypothetical protein T492DRAFT_1031935 [Pavlovales sp. CCMP2436]